MPEQTDIPKGTATHWKPLPEQRRSVKSGRENALLSFTVHCLTEGTECNLPLITRGKEKSLEWSWAWERGRKSIFPWSPGFYPETWAFLLLSFYFLPQIFWGQPVSKWLGGSLAASWGQPTTEEKVGWCKTWSMATPDTSTSAWENDSFLQFLLRDFIAVIIFGMLHHVSDGNLSLQTTFFLKKDIALST